jgi:hypothetical protein
VQDDDAFTRQMQRFLGEHNVPYSLPLCDEHGRYALRSPGKVEVLAKALLGWWARTRQRVVRDPGRPV